MYRIEVFFSLVVALIIILIFTQSISARIQYSSKLTITLEYFPISVVLYDFSKRKRKTKLKQLQKRLRLFFVPTLKSTRFLIKRTNTKIFSFDIPKITANEPHNIFILNRIKGLGTDYITAYLFKLSKNLYILTESDKEACERPLDLEFSTKLYNIPLAFFILLFFVIKNIGRNKKIV